MAGGILGKVAKAFVEEVPNEEYDDVTVEYTGDVEPDVEASVDGVNSVDTLLSDIYAANNLHELGESIFKVEEVSNSLPKEMVTDTKRTSVLSILSSFGLNATMVIEDGETRINILKSVNEQITTECNTDITEKENKIEDLKREIEALECSIAADNEKMKESDNLISGEIQRITKLIDFIGGDK